MARDDGDGELQVPTCRTVWSGSGAGAAGLGTCSGGLAVHAGLYTGPKQRPLHTWSKNSGNKVIATYSSLHFCLLRQTN